MKSRQNILETLGKRNKIRLEAACQQVINTGAYPSYTTIKRIMGSIDSDTKTPAIPRPAASNQKLPPTSESNTADAPAGAYPRGAGYYRTNTSEQG